MLISLFFDDDAIISHLIIFRKHFSTHLHLPIQPLDLHPTRSQLCQQRRYLRVGMQHDHASSRCACNSGWGWRCTCTHALRWLVLLCALGHVKNWERCSQNVTRLSKFHTSGKNIFRLFTLLIPMLQILKELVSSFFHMSLSCLRCFGLLIFGVSKCWGSGELAGFRGLGRIGGKIRNSQFN